LKYGKDGNLIRIEADKVGSEAVVSVINNGKMIPKESLDELFNRFYRVEASRSQQTGGTGLGLAIAQSIVSLHGGYIYAESNDKETKFVMHLPLKQTSC
ncbi:MAG TPA: two-component sensor histidine kinase, partial [Sporosarcina psychrophila]|nr:two-component sensor histidine kinase [Sporosarcina psychrophila]